MAKQQTYEVVITANGKIAERVMEHLKAEAEKLKEKLKLFKDTGRENTEEFRIMEGELKALEASINKVSWAEDRMNNYMQQIEGQSVNRLRSALRDLQKSYNAMIDDGSGKREQMAEAISRIRARLQELNDETNPEKQKQVEDYGKAWQTMQAGSDGKGLEQASIGDIRTAIRDARSHIETMGGDDAEMIKQATEFIKQAEARIKELTGATEKNTVATEQTKASWKDVIRNLDGASFNDLNAALKEAKEQLNSLPQGTQEYSRMERVVASLEGQMRKLKGETEQMDVNWRKTFMNLKKASNDELRPALAQLRKEIDALQGDDPRREKMIRFANRMEEQIKQNTKGVKEVTEATDEATDAAGKLGESWKDIAKKVSLVAIGAKAFDFVKDKIGEVMRGNLELSDSMAAVRKVTGLEADEISNLTTRLSKIDTRSTLMQLNAIAEAGGRMGIAATNGAEGIYQFTKAADQIQVSLGDDLGEGAIEQIAKLASNLNLFDTMGVENAMLAVGSSINELGATSTASGSAIVDFSRRLQSSAQLVNLSTADILALGAAVDSSGLSADVGSRAFSTFFSALRTNTSSIEKILSIEPGTLDTLYNAGRTIDAVLLVLDKMKAKGDLRELSPVFKELGSQGSQMAAVFGQMALNVDVLRSQLATSREAFQEQISITNEYNSVQETAQGLLERANNLWQNAFVNPDGVDMVKELAQAWYDFSKELTSSATFMESAKTSLGLIAGAAKILIQMLPVLIRLMMFYGVVASIKKVWVEFVALKAAIGGATGAQAKLNAVMKANAFAMIASVAATAITMLIDYCVATHNAKKEQNALTEAQDEAMKSCAQERGELKRLYEATQDQTKSIEERKEAVDELRKRFPDYFSDLTTEEILAGKAADAYRDLTEQIIASAKARAMEKKIEELQTQNIELEDDSRKRQAENDKNKDRYDEEKSKADAAVNQQNRMETTGAMGVGGKMGYVHSSNAGDKEVIGQYQENERHIQKNADQIAENNRQMQQLAESIKATKPTPKVNTDKVLANPSAYNKDALQAAYNQLSKQLSELKQRMGQPNNGGLKGDEVDKVTKQMDVLAKAIEKADKVKPGAVPPKSDKELKAEAAAQRKAGAEQRKREAAAEKADREALKQAKEDSNAILSNVEEYYKLQLATVSDMVAEGKLTKKESEVIKNFYEQKRHKALAEAQKAIAGQPNEFNEFRTTQMGGADMINRSEQAMTALEKTQTFDTQTAYVTLKEKGGESYIESLMAKSAQNTEQASTAAAQQPGLVRDMAKERLDRKYDPQIAQQERETRLQQATGTGQNIWQTYGLQDNIEGDPHIKMLELRMQKEQEWLNFLRESHAEQELISQQEQTIEETKMQMIEATAQKMQQRIDLIRNLAQPLEDFGSQVGTALAAFTRSAEEGQEAFKSALQGMLQSLAQTGIDMVKQWLMLRIKQKMHNALMGKQTKEGAQEQTSVTEQSNEQQLNATDVFYSGMSSIVQSAGQQIVSTKKSQAVENATTTAAETQGEVAAGIAGGAAKTIGKLGWWGIPLVAVITALLQGLLSLAMGALFGGSKNSEDKATNVSKAATKTKLVSGMLTYKKGNVQEVTGGGARGAMGGRRMVYDDGNVQVWDRQRPHPVVGTDGRVYMVTDQDELRTGLVTQPIATTVNGRPAIVGETGPEVVIGRDTTAAIMRKEPELLNRIAEIDKQHNSGAGQHAATGSPFRPLAEGNVGETISLSKSKRVEDVVKHYHVDTDSTESLTRWLRDFITVSKREDTKRSANETPVADSPTEATPADATPTVLRQWLADPEKHKQEIQTFYTTLRREEDSRQLHIKTEREQTTLLNEQRTANERRHLEEQLTRETIEQVYHGSDGRNYMAKTMQLPEGVTAITQPIATMVNGQPGLVAERGPEIVIGRETTRRLMMNQPRLIQALAAVDSYSSRRRLRTYDEGNVGEMAGVNNTSANGSSNGSENENNAQMRETLAILTEAVRDLQRSNEALQQELSKGIKASINKYGTGGLIDEVQSGLKFANRYK